MCMPHRGNPKRLQVQSNPRECGSDLGLAELPKPYTTARQANVPVCVISAALADLITPMFHLPHCGRIPAFMLNLLWGWGIALGYVVIGINRRSTVVKVMMIAGATLAMVTAAAAADLPRPQPVPPQPAYVGKMPIGKSPVGKGPVGKAPVAHY
jgi:hypothetical protein